MSTQTYVFMENWQKIILQLSLNTLLICPSDDTVFMSPLLGQYLPQTLVTIIFFPPSPGTSDEI